MAKSPRELLAEALALIDRDMQHLRGASDKKLSHQEAQDLAGYVSALIRCAESEEDRSEEVRENTSSMSQDDLLKRIQAQLADQGLQVVKRPRKKSKKEDEGHTP